MSIAFKNETKRSNFYFHDSFGSDIFCDFESDLNHTLDDSEINKLKNQGRAQEFRVGTASVANEIETEDERLKESKILWSDRDEFEHR